MWKKSWWSHFTYEEREMLWLQSGSQKRLPALQCCPCGWPLANAQHSDLTTLEWSFSIHSSSAGVSTRLPSEEESVGFLSKMQSTWKRQNGWSQFWRVTSRDDEIIYFWDQVGTLWAFPPMSLPCLLSVEKL